MKNTRTIEEKNLKIKFKNSCMVDIIYFTPSSSVEVKRSIEGLDPKRAAREKHIIFLNKIQISLNFIC